ncbi:hypothetical protein SAMN04487818_105474 [Actinokineospora terrae]|uniref:Pentapeptide repeat-containing protein n=1 Tax=Actinokineospora terrae TaxID=155974 RepID=A0A1H9SIC1_9PSEU|nr:hypothetical protein SAMN04487818_105474 [Actinokineospora terrae]
MSVCGSAQQILVRHLSGGVPQDQRKWRCWGEDGTTFHLDLSGAVLISLTMSYCDVDGANFSRCEFYGNTVFEGSPARRASSRAGCAPARA